MAFPCFPNTSSSDLFTIPKHPTHPTQPMPQNEAVMVSFPSGKYVTHSTTTSSIFTQYVEQEPPSWQQPPQFQLMRNPTAQPLVGLGQPVTGNDTSEPHLPEVIKNALLLLAYPEQQHSSITPRAERKTKEKHTELSNFPSEDNMIDSLLSSDEKYQTALSPDDLKKTVSDNYTPESTLSSKEIIEKYIPSQTEKRTRKPRVCLTEHAKAELMQKILTGDKKNAELAREYNISSETVQSYRRKIGVLLRLPRKTEKVLSGEETADLYMDERLSDDKLQKKYDISSSTLGGIAKSAGLDTKKDHKTRTRLTLDDELKLRADLSEKGTARLSNSALAAKYNVAETTIRRRIKQHELPQKHYLCDVSDKFKKYFQRDSSITPRAERKTKEKHIDLSDIPSEDNMIDSILSSDEKYQTTLSPDDLKKTVSDNYTPESTLSKEIIEKYIPSQTEKRTRKPRVCLTEHAKFELMQKILTGDKKDAELAREYNISLDTVQVLRRNMGILLRPPRKTEKVLSGEETADLYMDERLSDDKLQKKYDISSSTLGWIAKSADLDTKKDHKKRTKLTLDDEVKLRADLREKGKARLSNVALAAKYKIGKTTLQRRIKRYDLLQKYHLCAVSDKFKKYFQPGSSFLSGEDYVNPVTNR